MLSQKQGMLLAFVGAEPFGQLKSNHDSHDRGGSSNEASTKIP